MRLPRLLPIVACAALLGPAVSHAGYVVRFGATEVDIEPVVSGGSVSDYYDYDAANPEASDTLDGLEADNTGVFFLHEDKSGTISLVTLLDQYGSADVGKVNLVYTGASGSTWEVIDDPRSIDSRDVAGGISGGWDVKWTFDAGDADGGALTLASNSFCVDVSVRRSFGLSSYEVVSPDGSGGFTRTTIPSSSWGSIEFCSVPDTDGDGVPDVDDLCPSTSAGVKVDADGCPLDTDGDGVPDVDDTCPGTSAGVKVDADGCPLDTDGDGVPDVDDTCPGTSAGVKVDADGCPLDTDGDGVTDDLDDCAGTATGAVVDVGGCSVADYCPCSDPWTWRGEYLYCVYDEGKVFYDDGLISRTDFKRLLWAAVASRCGATTCRYR